MTDSNFVNPYEQIWKTRDLRTLETPLELENKLPEWRRGLGAFGKEMQATGYGLAALGSQGLENVVGENVVTKGITDWGIEGYNKSINESQTGLYAPSVAKIEDIKNASDAVDWAGYQLGKGLPMLGTLALSGGVGGAVARLGAKEGIKQLAKAGVGNIVKKGVEAGALKAAEGQVVTKAMQQAAAQSLRDTVAKGIARGGFVGSFGTEGGQAFGEQVQAGAAPADAVKSAIAVGGINGALEFLPFYEVAKRVGMASYAKKRIADIISNDAGLSKKAIALATAKELGGRAVKGGAVGAAVEGLTEGLQELTNIAGVRWAKDDPLFADLSNDDWSQVKNAMAAGVLVGGTAAGAGATVVGPEKATDKLVPAPIQSKLEALQANQAKLVEQINEAIKAGDTKKAEELQAIKSIYDLAINKTQEVIPAQEKPAPEGELVQEPAKETPVSEVAPVVEAGVPALEIVKPTEEKMANGQVQAKTEAPLTEVPIQEPSNTTPASPEQVLIAIANLSQREDAIQSINASGGKFGRNLPSLTIDDAGNIVLVRVGEHGAHFSKGWQDTSGKKNLMATTEISGGGNGLPTSAFSYWGENFLQGVEGRTAGTFRIPINDLLKASREGNAILGNLSEGEIILNPKFAKQYLSEINGVPVNNLDAAQRSNVDLEPANKLTQPAQEPNNLIASSLASTWEGASPETRANWLTTSGHSEGFSTRKAAEWDTWDKIPPAIAQQRLSKVMPVVSEVTTQLETEAPITVSEDQALPAASEVKQEPLYSRPLQKPAPTFYSALERATQETKQEKAAPAQWESSLDNMVKKGIVKQEELDWSGTKEWLQEQKEPVTKEALLKHVRDNTLEVKELELGAGELSARLNDSRNWEIVDSQGNIVDTFEDYNAENPTQALEYSGIEQPRNTRWTLPGGENQRELVLTAPSIEPFATDTTHYGDVGGGRAVAWVRFNDRIDEDGKKALFVEEIQSKRHQEGREKGYKDNTPINKDDLEIQDDGSVWGVYYKSTQLYRLPKNDNEDLFDAKKKLDTEIEENPNLLSKDNISAFVPNAPFKQTISGSGQTLSGWAGLAFKRMLRYAVENGYDKVAWTTGEQQAKRYNLAQSVSKVAYTFDGYFQAYDRNGRVVMSSLIDKSEVSNYIGKELTNELFAAPIKNGERIVELAEDKVIGGEGMKGFYDRLLPNEINKYVKKWGTKVDQTQMKFGDESASVHTVEVTPAMRDSVMQGQPLFSRGAGIAGQDTEAQRQYDAVVAAHTNPDGTKKEGWLKAPNGQPTKLNERQWVQTRTPNFIAWFGDFINDPANASKVVDENGEPLVMYRGLGDWNANLTKLPLIWVAASKKLASGYSIRRDSSRVEPYFVKSKNPFNVGSDNLSVGAKTLAAKVAKEATGEFDVQAAEAARKSFIRTSEPGKLNIVYYWQTADESVPRIFRRMLAAHGFDSVSVEEDVRLESGKTFGVFDATQIKSAISNTGEFYPANPDVLRTQQPNTTVIPLQDFHSNINSIMGEGWLQQAIDLGLVEVIEGPGPNGEAGSWVGDHIRLYTGSMPENGSPAGVLLHEGKHATFADVLGDTIQEYVKDLHTLANNGNKVAQDAITHAAIASADTLGIKHNLLEGGNKADLENLRAIIEARRPGLLAEEELAYFVQYGTEAQGGAGFLRRLINAIKAWFAQTRLGQRMKELELGFELTDAMAVEWAKMGLNRSIAELKQDGQVRAQVLKEAANMPTSERLGRALAALDKFDPLYSFLGKNALTANLSKLGEAELRIKNGEDKEVVRKETGWFLNEADGKWRFEIDDSKASFKTLFEDIPESILFGKEILLPLDEVLNHPELFKAYPQIKEISVIKRAGLDARVQGWFNGKLTIGLSPNATDPLSTLLHEIQHVIQMYEGFAQGGNENSVWDALPEEDKLKIARDALEKNNSEIKDAQNRLDVVSVFEENPEIIRNYEKARRYEVATSTRFINTADRYIEQKSASYERWTDAIDKLKKAEAILLDSLGRSELTSIADLPSSSYAELNRLINTVYGIAEFKAYKNNIEKIIVDLYQKSTKIKSGDEATIRKEADLYTFYRRLAGETEARLTQARQKMSVEERDLKSPESMQEYPYNEQIVVMPGAKTSGEVLYSMGVKELREQLWNDPTDSRLEVVNKPGLLQKLRADFVDFFAEMENKSKGVYDTYMLQRAKKGARIEKSRQAYLLPLRELITNSQWDAKEVGDMLAARHIRVDDVNTDLAERASQGYTKELLKALPDAKRKELTKARVNVKAGKMPDGSVYKDANGNVVDMSSRTKRKLMFDLMNQYAPFEVANTAGVQELNQEWEIFKDAAGGFSNGGIARGIVRTVDDVLAPASQDRAKFDEIANLFDAMNRHTLDILEEGGLITANEHARLLTSKSAYAPLRREAYNIDRDMELLFQRVGSGGSKQIGTRAGTANLSEPTLVLQNALAKVEAAAAAAERNLANKELYETIMTDREGWKPWFTIEEKDQYVTHDEDGFLQEKRSTASNRADIVLIKGGKKLVIRPNMHNERAMGFVRAVNSLDMQMLSGPMRVMNWANSLVRWVNVSASPVFLMSNLIRDPFTAAYNLQATEAAPYTKDIFLNWKRAFKALKKVYIDNNRDLTDADVRMLEKFEKAGGRTSFVLSLKEMDDNGWDNFEGQITRRQGSMKYLMAAKDKWLDGIENYNILFENIMRFSSFMTLMEKGGISETRAARISQDITTNFSRRGYKSQMLGVWWLFFNASVQGNYQVLRNLMSSKRVQAAVGVTMVTALTLDLLGRALADDWDEIPEWEKERFIILPIKVAGDFVKIPAPWVYNIIWRMGGMMGETLAGVRKPQDAVLDVAAMAMTSLNPLGKPGSLAQAITPTAADPFIQILENKDFAGNPIGPEGYPGASKKANSELLWGTTPKGYQSLARFVNEFTGGSAVESGKVDLRPGDYQILTGFLTGSLGKFLSDSTVGFTEKFKEGIEGPKDIPVVREFFADPYNPMLVQKYHTNIASVYGAHRLEQMYVKGPDRDLIKLQEVRMERADELRMYSRAQDVERQLKSLRVRLRAAQNREDTAREKELKERMSKVQEQFNIVYEQRVK